MNSPVSDFCQRYCSQPSLRAQAGSSPQLSVKVTNAISYGLPEFSHFLHLTHNFVLRVQLGKAVRKAAAQFCAGQFRWDCLESFYNVCGNIDLDLQVWSDYHHYYGGMRAPLGTLLLDPYNKPQHDVCDKHGTQTWQTVIRRPLSGASSFRQTGAEIEFTITATTSSSRSGNLTRPSSMTTLRSQTQSEGQLANPLKAFATAGPRREASFDLRAAVAKAQQAADDFRNAETRGQVVLRSLLVKAEALSRATEPFAQAHLSTKIAFYTLKGAVNILIAQMDRDARILNLVDTLSEVYNIILDRPDFDIGSVKSAVESLAAQSIECSLFIQAYAKQSFGERHWNNLASDIDRAITRHEQKLKELGSCLKSRVMNAIAKMVIRTLGMAKGVAINMDLNDMPYTDRVRYDRGKVDFSSSSYSPMGAQKILQWAMSDHSAETVFLLTGSETSASANSTLAHTIAYYFDTLGRLGSSFFFHKSTDPTYMFSTIARDLADLDDELRAVLHSSVKGRRAVCRTSSILEQFQEFIVPCFPLDKPYIDIGPTLIVLDRLDLCEEVGSERRRALLSILSHGVQSLSPNVKFLVTSCPDDDIMYALRNKLHIREMSM